MNKYVRVMDGLKSNAGGFNYKLDEINISEKLDTSTLDPEKWEDLTLEQKIKS